MWFVSRQARPVSVSLATGALASLPLFLLAIIVLGWLATDHAVRAALGQYPAERYFIEAYQSSARAVFVLGAVWALAIAVVMLGIAASVWAGNGRPSALTLGFPWLAAACGYGGLPTSVGAILSAEPDGHSLVRDYFPGWYSPIALTLVALMTICCLATTVLLARSGAITRAATAASAGRAGSPSAGRKESPDGLSGR